ncbi:MAG: efflux RND transporter periplasmic adaptor subunit [Bacteroidota bacterium]
MKAMMQYGSILLLLAGCGNNNGDSVETTGTLEATETTVSSQVNGLTKELRVQEGTPVGKGDTLVVIDATEWQYQLDQAEANLRALDASYSLALKGPREEDVVQARAQYESAKNDLKRMEDLFRTNSVPEKQLEDARTRHTVADQTLRKLNEGTRKEELALAKARRDQAVAAAGQLRKKFADCTITAPVPGIVVNTFVEPGELVIPGAVIVRIADVSEMKISVYVSEVLLPRIRLGQKATVSVDAYDNRSFEGEVIYISPTAEFTPKNIQTKEERVKLVFAVKIRVKNPDNTLKAGLPADVVIALSGAAHE